MEQVEVGAGRGPLGCPPPWSPPARLAPEYSERPGPWPPGSSSPDLGVASSCTWQGACALLGSLPSVEGKTCERLGASEGGGPLTDTSLTSSTRPSRLGPGVFESQTWGGQHGPRAWRVLGPGSQADRALVTGLVLGPLGCSQGMTQGDPCFGSLAALQSPTKRAGGPILAFVKGAHESQPRHHRMVTGLTSQA